MMFEFLSIGHKTFQHATCGVFRGPPIKNLILCANYVANELAKACTVISKLQQVVLKKNLQVTDLLLCFC